jgi:hypothetical protein
MNRRASISYQAAQFELCFESLSAHGRSLAFPCDADGRVDMDALSEAQRQRYFYARAVVGREFAQPAVKRSGQHSQEDTTFGLSIGRTVS